MVSEDPFMPASWRFLRDARAEPANEPAWISDPLMPLTSGLAENIDAEWIEAPRQQATRITVDAATDLARTLTRAPRPGNWHPRTRY